MKTNNKLNISKEELATITLNDIAVRLGHNVSYGTKIPNEYFKDFMSRMINKTDLEIVECFNSQVGIKGWTGATGAYMSAIRNQFDMRNIDYSEVGDSTIMSYIDKVTMIEKKLIIINTNKK